MTRWGLVLIYLWKSTETKTYALRKAFNRPKPKGELNLCPKQDMRGLSRPLSTLHRPGRTAAAARKSGSFPFTWQLPRGVGLDSTQSSGRRDGVLLKSRNAGKGRGGMLQKRFIWCTAMFPRVCTQHANTCHLHPRHMSKSCTSLLQGFKMKWKM